MAATPYPAYGALYIKRLLNTVGPRKRSAAGQAVPDPVPVVVPDGGALRLIRATVPYISNGYSTPLTRASAAPPGKLYQTPFPSL
ncbi:TPA: hypothetical protein ACWXBI_002711, partial [Klebsiella pneumoniae]